VLKNDSRFLYQAINNRNIIVTSLIDIIISKDNYEEGDFLLLPSKPKFGLKIMGYNKDELDVSYEQSIQLNLINVFNDEVKRNKLIEEMCLNFCFRQYKQRKEPAIIQPKLCELLYGNLFPFNLWLSKLKTEQLQQMEQKDINHLYMLNLNLILCKNLIVKHLNDKFIQDLIYLLNRPLKNFETVVYNAISLLNSLVPNSRTTNFNREDAISKKLLVKKQLAYGMKLKQLLISKIFTSNKKKVDFEQDNVKI